MNVVYYKVLKINVFRFFKECHLKMMPALLIAAAAGVLISKFTPFSGWLRFLIEGMCFVLVYALVIWFAAWNKYEKELFSSNLLKIIKRK